MRWGGGSRRRTNSCRMTTRFGGVAWRACSLMAKPWSRDQPSALRRLQSDVGPTRGWGLDAGRHGRVSGETCWVWSRAGIRALVVVLRPRPEGTDRERTGQQNPVVWKGGRKGESRDDRIGTTERRKCRGGYTGRRGATRLRVGRVVRTKRMLSALGNGVKGGRWYALVDKVFAPNTLAAAWTKVRANKGVAGVDGQSIDGSRRGRRNIWPSCRGRCGRSYRPQAVKRVDIPKGDGRTRPLAFRRSRTASSSRPSGS